MLKGKYNSGRAMPPDSFTHWIPLSNNCSIRTSHTTQTAWNLFRWMQHIDAMQIDWQAICRLLVTVSAAWYVDYKKPQRSFPRHAVRTQRAKLLTSTYTLWACVARSDWVRCCNSILSSATFSWFWRVRSWTKISLVAEAWVWSWTSFCTADSCADWEEGGTGTEPASSRRHS